jgi:hypothetical protein
MNPGLCCEKPAPNRPSYGKASEITFCWVICSYVYDIPPSPHTLFHMTNFKGSKLKAKHAIHFALPPCCSTFQKKKNCFNRSSGQSFCYRSRGPRFDSRRFQIFWEAVGLERGPLILVRTTEELLERNTSGSGQENRNYDRGDPLRWPRNNLYPQKLVLLRQKAAVARSA